MFQTIAELVTLAEKCGSVAEVMILAEMETTEMDREVIWQRMEKNLSVMEASVNEGGKAVRSVSGLTGGDAKKLDEYILAGNSLNSELVIRAVRNAVAVNEVNARMGVICANPTAGSAGVAAGVITALGEVKKLSEEEKINFLFAAGAFGLVVAKQAYISGAMGGCQAEIGSASAMAAAALVETLGGTPRQCAHAFAMTIKNMMGLICDPVAGLVEVPCVKRNALGAAQAFISADMALAGIESVIPADEVLWAMKQVGQQMPGIFKETAEGGIAATPTAKKLEKKISASESL